MVEDILEGLVCEGCGCFIDGEALDIHAIAKIAKMTKYFGGKI